MTVWILVLGFWICTASSAWSFSFAVMGDNRGGDSIFKAILSKISSDKSIAFVVNTGDFTPTGSKWEYKKYISMIGAHKLKFYNTIGNHDRMVDGNSTYLKMFGNTYFSWDFEGCHFLCLDNVSQAGLGQEQHDWLAGDLNTNKRKIKFVFMHKPIFDVTGSYPDTIMYPKRVGKDIIKLFEKNNVKAVFWGHIHGYGKEKVKGISYILTGGGGAPLYLPEFSGGFNHYVKVSVDGGKVYDEVVKVEE